MERVDFSLRRSEIRHKNRRSLNVNVILDTILDKNTYVNDIVIKLWKERNSGHGKN